jgi:integrase
MVHMQAIQRTVGRRRQTEIEAAYDEFRLDKQSNLISSNTLDHYHYLVGPFFDWLRDTHPEVDGFGDLKVSMVRQYKAARSQLISKRTGEPYEPATILDGHRLLKTFMRWAAAEEYPVDPGILGLKALKIPDKEPTVYHIKQLKAILAVCELPQEGVVVKTLVGSGARASEVCGIAVEGPDGLSDVMTDSLARGRVELRVRWDSGAKGKKSRRVPITPKLAKAPAAVREALQRARPGTAEGMIRVHRLEPGAWSRPMTDHRPTFTFDGPHSPDRTVAATDVIADAVRYLIELLSG